MFNSAPPDRSADNRRDGPSGIGGWLAYLIVAMMLIGPLLGAGRIYGGITALEQGQTPQGYDPMTFQTLFSIFPPDWITIKKTIGWGFSGIALLSMLGGWRLLHSRDWSAVRQAIVILWTTGPIATFALIWIVPQIISGFVLVSTIDEVIVPVVVSGIAAAIWTAYLLKSVRVRNTYNRVVPELKGHVLREAINASGQVPAQPTARPRESDIDTASVAWVASADTASSQKPFAEEELYCIAWNELKLRKGDKALLAKAYAECNGDHAKTRAYYLRERAKRLHEGAASNDPPAKPGAFDRWPLKGA